MNSPNLSYLIVPLQDKLFCLYNSFVHNDQLYAASTVLNRKGQLVTDQGVLFWGLKAPLDFQRSRQVAKDQVVIPYQRFNRPGFAVVELRWAAELSRADVRGLLAARSAPGALMANNSFR